MKSQLETTTRRREPRYYSPILLNPIIGMQRLWHHLKVLLVRAQTQALKSNLYSAPVHGYKALSVSTHQSHLLRLILLPQMNFYRMRSNGISTSRMGKVILRTLLAGGRYVVATYIIHSFLTFIDNLFQTHGGSYAIAIRQMACDFLAIPATSVSVERTFSRSRHICSDLRCSLKAQTITQSLLSKVWIRSGLLDPNPPQPPRQKHGAPRQ